LDQIITTPEEGLQLHQITLQTCLQEGRSWRFHSM